jgi:hypothetical protein
MFASLFRALGAETIWGVLASFAAANRTGAKMRVFAVQAAAYGADAAFKVLAPHLDLHFLPLMVAESRQRGRAAAAPPGIAGSRARSLIILAI